MDREPAADENAGPRPPAGRGTRRRLTIAAAAVALLLVIAVLATRLYDSPPAAGAAAKPTTSPSPSPGATLPVPVIYSRVAPSVVLVQSGHEQGTGVIVANNGTILTAAHVISGGKPVSLTFADGTKSGASVASVSAAQDIAMLIPSKLPSVVVPATLGGAAAVGDAVVAIGDPLGLTDSVSAGVISGLDRTATTDAGQHSGLIQFDAAVNPGSSGGPLLDAHAMVVGIVVGVASHGGDGAFAGIGFAVPIGSALSGGGQGGNGPRGPQI